MDFTRELLCGTWITNICIFCLQCTRRLENLLFYLHLIQLQTSNFQLLQSGISKIEKNRCSCCCSCYSVPPPRIRQIISRTHFLTMLQLIMLQLIKINWECTFILIKFAHGTDVCRNILFLRLVHLCKVFENCSIRLSNDWNHFYKTTDHLQQFRGDKFSAFFKSEVLTFSSAS